MALRRITVNLAPAGLRKEGSGFDLPIALAVLAASQPDPARCARRPCGGRRAALDGRCGPSPGALAAAEGARRARPRKVLCAAESAPEVALAGVEPIRCGISQMQLRTSAASATPPPVEPARTATASATARSRRCARPGARTARARDRGSRPPQPAARRPAGYGEDDARTAPAGHPAAARRGSRARGLAHPLGRRAAPS